MTVRVRWTEPAARALERIQDYLDADSPRAARTVTRCIRLAVHQLGEYPRIGRPGRVVGTFELVVPGIPYIVPYRIRDNEIQVLSVYHTSRKWPESFK